MKFTFDKVFNALKNEVFFLYAKWQIYEKIYGKSAERIKLINLSASSFFYNLQFLLLDDIELTISKLLDPAIQGSNKNLCLDSMCLLIDDLKLQSKLKIILIALQSFSKEIRDRRNKRLSHYDLETTVIRTKNFFTKTSRKQINEILDKFQEFLNLIEFHYYKKSTIYDLITSSGDADALIQCLKRSESYKLLEKQGKFEHGFFRMNGPFSKA